MPDFNYPGFDQTSKAMRVIDADLRDTILRTRELIRTSRVTLAAASLALETQPLARKPGTGLAIPRSPGVL